MARGKCIVIRTVSLSILYWFITVPCNGTGMNYVYEKADLTDF